jgi:C4-dicarboxylate-specific signal transduction histidine kinase
LAAIGQMTASIGHELRQPIGATINNAKAALSWLQRQPPELDEVREALHDIVLVNKRAVEIIERIKTLLKKAPVRAERVELNGAIKEVIELTRGEIVNNGVSLRLQLAERLPFVEGDRIQLQQVVLNLVINAVEAMRLEPTRELVVSTNKADPSDVIVAVQDLGCGLSEVQIARLFEFPFYSTKPDGLGLGLSICHLIIEQHGGRLWATPNLPRGTTFQFTLPASQDN